MVLLFSSGGASANAPGMKPSDRITGFDEQGIRFAPEYRIYINGVILEDQPFLKILDHITEIVCEDNEQLFDKISITITGMLLDTKSSKFIPAPEWVLTSGLFKDGDIITVLAGYNANLKVLGAGEIIKREFFYGQKPRCIVHAYEPIYRMAQVAPDNEDKKRWGKRGSTTEIVREIGLKTEYSSITTGKPLFDVSEIDKLPAVTKEPEIQKVGQTDFDFIKDMAGARGYSFYSRFDFSTSKFKLYYGPDADRGEVLFNYSFNKPLALVEDQLLEFTPTISLIDQHTEFSVVHLVPNKDAQVKDKQSYRTAADGPRIGKEDKGQAIKNSSVYRLNILGVSKRIVSTRPFNSETELKQFSLKWAREHMKQFMTGNGKVLGNEMLQSRTVLYFSGLGERLSGTFSSPIKWYLTKVVHKIDKDGFTTEFDCRQVVDWIPKDDIIANPPKKKLSTTSSKQAYRTKPGALALP